MILLIIIIVLIVIYNRHKKKQQEQAIAENIMQGSEIPPVDESSQTLTPNSENPFIQNVNNNIPVNADNPLIQNDAQVNQNENEYINNPFIDGNTNCENSNDNVNEYNNSDLNNFPVCPINDNNILSKNKKLIRTLRYNNGNFVAFSYNYNGKKLLLFQEISFEDKKIIRNMVEYGYLWLKLFYICKKYVLFQDKYDNTPAMPKIDEEELDKAMVKEFLNDFEEKTAIEFKYPDGSKKNYWRFGMVDFEGFTYAFLVSENNVEDKEIDKIIYNNNGSVSYEEVNDYKLRLKLLDLFIDS